MTDAPLLRLTLDAIDEGALPRDRTGLDPEALAELQTSILMTGLRQPIEVYEMPPDPADPDAPRYGLISGMRRLTVFRRLAGDGPDNPRADPRFAEIPAFLRTPRDGAEAMAAMIAENEIRADLSPWEKGRIVVEARDCGLFDTLDEAVTRLYPALDRFKRNRIRAVADVVDALPEGILADPKSLNQQQLTRLGTALRAGLGPLIETALAQSSETSPQGQWRVLLSIIDEAEEEAREASRSGAARRRDYRTDYRPGRPRRMARPRAGLVIRRERTAEGWNLRFTGPEATGPLMEDIMDYVEHQFGRE